MLSDPERRVLGVHCVDHPVAVCDTCRVGYKLNDLGVDIIGRRYYFCPSCRLNLLDRIRLHILSCPAISAALDERIARSARAIKESDRLRTQSAILAAESHEVACLVLDTKRRSPSVASTESVTIRVAAAIIGRQRICAECAALAAGVAVEVVIEHVDKVAAHIRIDLDRGTCGTCQRHDVTVMSFVATEEDTSAL